MADNSAFDAFDKMANKVERIEAEVDAMAEIEDMSSKSDDLESQFAALEGSTSQQFVQSRLPKASLVTTPDYDEAVKLLLADEVTAVVADREIVTLTAFLHPKEGLTSLREPLTIEPIGMAVPPGDALLVNFLENAMDALETSGFMSAIRARWLERSDWVQELP